ncbi:MAG: polymer-forming cytoskeletal protein [Nitrospirae bacterium]|nr:polymer-forming cytoskeletal protein [Nitrospirota bacterium]
MDGQDGQTGLGPTMIGSDTIITGTIRAQGTVWMDGRVEGNIYTDGLLMIGETAVVIGNIEAGSVICRGMIMGDIVASEEVELLESASLNGTVRAPLFSVDDGVLVNDNMETAYAVEELSGGEVVPPIRAVA